MAFTCENEIEIVGGAAEERERAASLVLALECVDEGSASRADSPGALTLRFGSSDGLPEGELPSIAAQFPGMAFTLAYFSLDGEFYGYARAGEGGEAAESEDLDEAAREAVGARHEGDVIAFVRERYALATRKN
jgi:hypothetical protein